MNLRTRRSYLHWYKICSFHDVANSLQFQMRYSIKPGTSDEGGMEQWRIADAGAIKMISITWIFFPYIKQIWEGWHPSWKYDGGKELIHLIKIKEKAGLASMDGKKNNQCMIHAWCKVILAWMFWKTLVRDSILLVKFPKWAYWPGTHSFDNLFLWLCKPMIKAR